MQKIYYLKWDINLELYILTETATTSACHLSRGAAILDELKSLQKAISKLQTRKDKLMQMAQKEIL